MQKIIYIFKHHVTNLLSENFVTIKDFKCIMILTEKLFIKTITLVNFA